MKLVTKEQVEVHPGGVNGALVLIVSLGTAAVMALGIVLAWQIERIGTGLQRDTPPARFGAPPRDMNGIEMSTLVSGVGAASGRHDSLTDNRHGHTQADRDSVKAAPTSDTASNERTSTDDAEKRLRSYGWQSREQQTLHIPIGRAIELYLARELSRAPVGAEPGASSAAREAP